MSRGLEKWDSDCLGRVMEFFCLRLRACNTTRFVYASLCLRLVLLALRLTHAPIRPLFALSTTRFAYDRFAYDRFAPTTRLARTSPMTRFAHNSFRVYVQLRMAYASPALRFVHGSFGP